MWYSIGSMPNTNSIEAILESATREFAKAQERFALDLSERYSQDAADEGSDSEKDSEIELILNHLFTVNIFPAVMMQLVRTHWDTLTAEDQQGVIDNQPAFSQLRTLLHELLGDELDTLFMDLNEDSFAVDPVITEHTAPADIEYFPNGIELPNDDGDDGDSEVKRSVPIVIVGGRPFEIARLSDEEKKRLEALVDKIIK